MEIVLLMLFCILYEDGLICIFCITLVMMMFFCMKNMFMGLFCMKIAKISFFEGLIVRILSELLLVSHNIEPVRSGSITTMFFCYLYILDVIILQKAEIAAQKRRLDSSLQKIYLSNY